jgi:hypothetical protein
MLSRKDVLSGVRIHADGPQWPPQGETRSTERAVQGARAEAQVTFVPKQAADGTPVAEVCRRAVIGCDILQLA